MRILAEDLYPAFSDDMWEISLGGQVTAFLYSLMLGASLCLFYDIIRATRKAGANSFFAVFVGDILFWTVSAVVVFIFLVAVTNGEIRGYILFSAVVGFVIYRLTLGKPVFFVMTSAFVFFARIICQLSFFLLKLCDFVEIKLNVFLKKILFLLKRCRLAAKKLLKSIWNMLYTSKNNKDTENVLDE